MERFYFIVAGILLVVMFGCMFLVGNPNAIGAMRYLGWVVWVVAVVLIPMPWLHFRKKGKISTGRDITHTTVLVDSGIYAVIRHPQYLGWLLMYPAMYLFTQHWFLILLGSAGIMCVLLFTRGEDQRLIERFGDEYRQYMQRVPSMNVPVGLIRLAQRKRS